MGDLSSVGSDAVSVHALNDWRADVCRADLSFTLVQARSGVKPALNV